jgi:cytochrome o ubiquinol oxidase subunit 2
MKMLDNLAYIFVMDQNMLIRAIYKSFINIAAGVGMTLALGGCAIGILDPKGPVGKGDSTILIDAVLIMLVIVVPTILLAFWMAWRYRASNTAATYRPTWAYSGKIEAVVWSIPILTVMFLSGVIWIGCYRLDPFKPLESKAPALEVQVVSLDWKWLFIYPAQNIATVNQLVIPAGRPVHFSITSASVFNAFFVPQLGSMIYAMPGMTSQLYLQADAPGIFLGESAHFSGDGFSDMNFQVSSVTDQAFAAWVSKIHSGGSVLDQASYDLLARQSRNVKPYGYKAIDPALFHQIATGMIEPAPGPAPEGAHAGREETGSGRP